MTGPWSEFSGIDKIIFSVAKHNGELKYKLIWVLKNVSHCFLHNLICGYKIQTPYSSIIKNNRLWYIDPMECQST